VLDDLLGMLLKHMSAFALRGLQFVFVAITSWLLVKSPGCPAAAAHKAEREPHPVRTPHGRYGRKKLSKKGGLLFVDAGIFLSSPSPCSGAADPVAILRLSFPYAGRLANSLLAPAGAYSFVRLAN
jgi:hypothetical protein